MAYHVGRKDPYPEAEFPVYPKMLDVSDDKAFHHIPYEADSATLDLHAVEKEWLAKGNPTIGHGYRIQGDLAPKKLLWPCGDRPLPDVIPSSVPAYSPRLRDLIEQFEPGVHQFFPVDIYKTPDGPVEATHYWFNACNRIDSVNAELTNYEWKKDYTGRGFWSKTNVAEPKLVFAIHKIADLDFWYDPYLGQGTYCSNAFAEAALASNFTGLSLTQRAEA